MVTVRTIENYFDLGFVAFPLRIELTGKGKKKPVIFEWRKEPVTLERSIKELKPGHNAVALVTGAENDLFVLDFDNKDGSDVIDDKFAEYNVVMPADCPVVKSWSGGTHYYFKFPDGIKGSTTRSNILPGFDIRGEGGIIFAPPTTIDGKKYEFLKSPKYDLPEVPEQLIRLINDLTEHREKKSDTGKQSEDDRRTVEYAREAIGHLVTKELNYDDWIKCGMALSVLGETGRELWHELSNNEFYDDTTSELDYKFDNFLESRHSVNIASLFHVAKDHGFHVPHKTHTLNPNEPSSIPDDIIYTQTEIFSAIRHQYQNAEQDKYSIGYGSTFDDMCQIAKGQIVVVTGVPQSGKSNFLDDVLVNLSQRYEWKHVVFSPESLPINDHIDSIASKAYGTPIRRGFTQHMNTGQHLPAAAWIRDHFAIIDAIRVSRKLDDLLAIVERVTFEEKVDSFVLDPWNELEHSRPGNITETEYVSYTLGRLKAFALSLDITIFIVAHPAKLAIGKDGKRSMHVGPYDISGSANWWNKCDVMWSVYRDFANDKVKVNIHKVKKSRFGRIGWVQMEYIKPTGKYTAIGNSTQQNNNLDDVGF